MAKAVRKTAASYSPSAAARFVRTRASAMLAHGEASGQFSAERASLVKFLREKGLILDSGFCSGFRPVSEGAEHIVYHDEALGRAVKITRPNTFGHSVTKEASKNVSLGGTPCEYLRRLAYHNYFFGDDIKIIGAMVHETSIQVLTSQPWILYDEAPLATEEAISLYFTEIGFVKANLYPEGYFYYSPLANIAAADASPSNVVFSNAGALIPIDVVIGMPDEEHKAKIWSAQGWKL